MLIIKIIENKITHFLNFLKRISSNKITYKGSSFKLRANNWITKYRFDSFKSKEPETLDWIDYNLKENDFFFDIGANVGIYSLYGASKNIYNTKFYCFEPEYSNLNELKFNIIQNNFNDLIFPFSLAFGEKESLSFLNIYDPTPGAALHTLSREKLKKNNVILSEGVVSYSLDSFCKKTGIYPNLIKIDIDGKENDLLLGARETLKNKKLRSIIIELEDKEIREECIEFLKINDFKLVKKFHKIQKYIWKK